jgi:flagellum-specific ATP synthase
VLSRDLAQRGQYPAIDIAASLSRVMDDVVAPDHARLARLFRSLTASYEANRDLVLMGAYRAGADPQLDRAIAMHASLTQFLCQEARTTVDFAASLAALTGLLGHAA